MCMWRQGGLSFLCVVSLMLGCAGVASAANATWSGTTDSFWDKDSNWGGLERPYGNETATFNGPGDGHTTISLAKIGSKYLAIRDVVFTGPECAAYTLGLSGQLFWLMSGGTLTIDADVVNDQTIAGTTRYGNSNSASTTIKLINNSPVAKLLLNGANGFTTLKPGYKPYVLVRFEGGGDITFNNRLTTNGVTRFYLSNHNTGTITFAGAGESRVNYLHLMNGSASPGNTRVVVNSGTELFLDYGSADDSLWNEGDGVIEGEGTLRFGTGIDDNFARVYVKTGSTLTIQTPLTSAGGLEMRSTYSGGGTLVLDCVNTMASNLVNSSSGAFSVARIGNRGSTDSNVGCGQCILLSGNNSGLIYTGTGETTDRLIEFSANARLDQSGSGDLILSEDLIVGANAKTITLTGSSDGAGEIAGVIGPGADTTSLAKDGSGLWRLTAANTYDGATTVRNGTLALSGADGAITGSAAVNLEGGVLRLEPNAGSNNVNRVNNAIPLTLKGGALECVYTDSATNYSESVGPLTVNEGSSTISAAQVDEGYTSILTFASLERTGVGTVNFTGVGLGEDNRNRILFATPPPLVNGYIGNWATCNGTALAMYDETLGVIPGPSIEIAARGPNSVIPDNTALSVQITTAGTEGAITLEGTAGSSIYSLNQLTDTPAVVATINKTLSACSVMIDHNAGALTIGENAGDGMVTAGADDRELLLANLSTNALTINAAVADNSGATALTKTGPGRLIFNSVVDVTGEMVIQEGALTLSDVAGQTHQFGSIVTTGGAERPTILNIEGPTEIVNFGNIAHTVSSGDRCIMNISNDLTIQGDEKENGKFIVGPGNNMAGAVLQSAGAVSVSSGRSGTAFFSFGNLGGYGYYRMTGGSCTSGEIAIGGPGTFSGGNIGVCDLYDGELTVDGWCLLIAWARGIGTLNIFGGSFSGIDEGGEVICAYNQNSDIIAQLNLLGPEARMFDRGSATKKLINLANSPGNTLGALNLNNGELTLYQAYAKTNTTPTHFNFNGGLLIAATNSPHLMQDLTAAHVFPGNARIDTAGYDVTINQPLVAPTGYGVTEIVLSAGGADYIGAPAVQIAGGSGIGATAIALVDLEAESPTCGQVTNILVTSAGSGYYAADTLVATLRGGGCLTPAAAGTVTLSANTSGGLTKLGAGTLRLGGAGTYSGATIVSNGTLLVNGSHAGGGGYTFASGTTLGGTGTVALASGTVDLQPGVTLAVDPASAAEDRLTVSSLTLSDNLVAVAQIGSLDKKEIYPILTCTGTITGSLATHIADSSWGVKRIGETFYLRYNAGALIMIR